MLYRIKIYYSVCSIFVRCTTNELPCLKQSIGFHPKIDSIYDDDTRLLIKLVIELALASEEIGDQLSEDENNELKAQRNYQRALNLCALAKEL